MSEAIREGIIRDFYLFFVQLFVVFVFLLSAEFWWLVGWLVGWFLGCFVGWNVVSLCGSSWPGICYVDQVSLELTEILLCWD